MKILTIAAFVLFSIACIQFPVSAACGGGGWHKSKSAPVTVAAADPVVDAEYVSHERSSDRSADKMSLDTAHFDSVSSQMRLSERQRSDIRQAEDDIRERVNALYDAKTRAESKYARCTGNCDKERRNRDQANSAYSNFVPNKEFDRRLSSILNDQQLNTYRR